MHPPPLGRNGRDVGEHMEGYDEAGHLHTLLSVAL